MLQDMFGTPKEQATGAWSSLEIQLMNCSKPVLLMNVYQIGVCV